MSSSTDAPASDASLEAHRLVARFLRHHRYESTLASFLADSANNHPRLESHLARPRRPDTGEDLQDVVDEWLAARLARLRVHDSAATLRDQLDQLEYYAEASGSSAAVGPARTAWRETSNVLTVSRAVVPRREWDSSELRFRTDDVPCLLTTAVDRTLTVHDSATFALVDSYSLPSPCLSLAQHPVPEHRRFVLCATMEGSLLVVDLVSREVKARVKDHTKYIVKVAISPDGRHVATLGYDKFLTVYRLSLTSPSSSSSSSSASSDAPALLDGEAPDPLATCPHVALEQVHRLATRSNPEAAVWLPDGSELVWSAREDHRLHYLRMTGAAGGSGREGKGDERGWTESYVNLNPNGDAFVSFSILSITLHPTLPLLSLQTSTTSARLLLYPFHSSTRLATIHTTAAQSDYFSPRHAWLPDGSAAVVNSEDGVVRVVDVRGNVRVFQGAHGSAAPLEGGEGEGEGDELRSERARLRREADRGSSVVRDVEVLVDEEDSAGRPTRWRIVSCGFDKTVKVIG
ncbi:hypothetical protein JCM3775_000943 [Rhodotorula graminis]|uniref:Uncharacterized protein n=1 Tax=Rhodotorula graminis (strain WP1) TaxID=578459 RepID=A0A194S5X1_RHOGW|nr:uncharacterized protein RHOBADRAFT_44344 [Rhodotorula graminis WP1]KPV74821.1 hypothetical protein RHOBADRAFT_44344 [Rhodotorula graminis WP1]